MVCCAYAGGTYIFIGNDNVFPMMHELAPVTKTKRRRRLQKQMATAKNPPAPKVATVEIDEERIAFSQYGGTRSKKLLDDDKDASGSSYRMICNASNERRKTKFLARRRHQVHCY
jgi:hypothetical protein